MSDIEKRLRYFNGQFLKDEDFNDEQKYHIDRQRRPLRQLHVSGIVEGLTLQSGSLENSDEQGRATVMPGTAIDRQGRQIVLGSPENIALKDFVNSSSNSLLEVYISYKEIGSNLAGQDNDSYRRWHEQPLITVIKMDESGKGIPEDGIRLGVITLNDRGQVTIQDAVRRYAGIYLPSASDRSVNAGLTLRSTGSNGLSEATLTGKLTVTEGLDVAGTLSVNENLNVSGSLSVTDIFSPTGALSMTGDVSLSGALSVTESLEVAENLSAPRISVGTQTLTAALTVQTPDSYTGNTIRFEAKAEPSRYFLNLNTVVSDSVVRWVFDQKNLDTSFPAVLAFDRGRIGMGTSTPIAKLEIPGMAGDLLSVGATSGSEANIDLAGHVQFREHKQMNLAFIQARDDKSNRNIGLRFRTQLQGSRERVVTEALTIEPNGMITSPMWRVTQVLNNQVFDKAMNVNFLCGGGTLIVMASGSGFRGSSGPVGMSIIIDNTQIGLAEVWTNESGSHKSFVANFMVIKAVNAGFHILKLVPFAGTTIDTNDRCSATILELPF
jgi:hypothetical protein